MSIKNLAGRASAVEGIVPSHETRVQPLQQFLCFLCCWFFVSHLNQWHNSQLFWFIGIYHWYLYLPKLTCLGVMHTSYICFQCDVWCVCGRINSQHASIAAAFEQVSLSLSCWWKLPAGSHSMTSLCCMMRSFSINMVLSDSWKHRRVANEWQVFRKVTQHHIRGGLLSERPRQWARKKTSPCERSNEGKAAQQQTQHQKIL